MRSGILLAAGGLCRAVVAQWGGAGGRSCLGGLPEALMLSLMRPCYPLAAGEDYIRFPHCGCQIPAREGRHCRDKGAQQCLIGKQIPAADWREMPTNIKRKGRAGPLARLIKPAAGWEQSREGLSCACPAMITPGCMHAMTSNITFGLFAGTKALL